MNKKTIIIIFALAIVLIVAGFWFKQKNNQAAQKGNMSCTDSDNGKNIYVKGRALTVSGGKTLHITGDSCATHIDKAAASGAQYIEGLASCAGENCYVSEGYCGEYQGSQIDSQEFINCPNGCSDGACVQ